MNSNIEGRIEPQLTALVQAKWEELIKDTGIDMQGATIEQLILMRDMFQIAYQYGISDHHQQIKEIFHNDIDKFEEMFEYVEDEDE